MEEKKHLLSLFNMDLGDAILVLVLQAEYVCQFKFFNIRVSRILK